MNVLVPGRLLFGEWCYAVHSIHYDRLPDWFLAFDLYDWRTNKFLSRESRHNLLKGTGIQEVPFLGTYTVEKEQDLINILNSTPSRLYDGPVEGIYLRTSNEDGYLDMRAKLVRPDFTQSIKVHWSKNKLITNRKRDSDKHY